jgi:hypothetical protein
MNNPIGDNRPASCLKESQTKTVFFEKSNRNTSKLKKYHIKPEKYDLLEQNSPKDFSKRLKNTIIRHTIPSRGI